MNTKICYILFILFCQSLFLCACAGELTRTAFTAERENLPKEHENLKIVFFADLHLRKETIQEPVFEELVEKVNKENAHFILIGGDLIDRTVKDYMESFTPAVKAYLQKFRSKYGIIFCSGNHEQAAKAQYLICELKKSGMIFADDEFYAPTVNGKKLFFYAQKERTAPKRIKGKKWRKPPWEYYHMPTEKLKNKHRYIPDNAPLFILSHRPELFDFLHRNENIFILAGHYHGGLIDLPFLSAKRLLSWYQKRKFPKRPELKYIHGKYEEGKKLLYVTSGISGGDHSALRINVPREYVVITLTGKGEAENASK